MNIFVLTATLSLNCFVNKAGQARKPLARAVTRALSEYSLLAPLSLRAVKERLPRSAEVPPVVRALPQVALAATCSPVNMGCQEPG